MCPLGPADASRLTVGGAPGIGLAVSVPVESCAWNQLYWRLLFIDISLEIFITRKLVRVLGSEWHPVGGGSQ